VRRRTLQHSLARSCFEVLHTTIRDLATSGPVCETAEIVPPIVVAGSSVSHSRFIMRISTVAMLHALVVSTAAVTTTQDDLDAKATAMANAMTLDQLLGQMTQVDNSAVVTDGPGGQKVIDPAKLASYASQGVGSYINFVGAAVRGNHILRSPADYRALLKQVQAPYVNGIPMIYGLDSVHGANYIDGAVLFPHNINVGMTFNPSLASDLGKYMARDTKAAGIPWMFGPTLDITRHKHWPRMYETFSEDPTVVADMAAHLIPAIQSQGVAACFKHFIGYSDPTDGNDRSNVVATTYEQLNYFAPPFKAAVDANVMSGMGTFVAMNGVPLAANAPLHHGLLRHDLGFTGLMVTDWEEIYLLNRVHHAVTSDQDAIALSLTNATYDMVMVPYDTGFIALTKPLVPSKVPLSRLKTSVARILKLKMQVGLFESPVPGADVVDAVGDAASQAAARAIATESLVLLKNNDRVLPINTTTKTVFFTGPSVDNVGFLCGGWSIYWQGASGNAMFPHGTSIRQAMNATITATMTTTYHMGIDIAGAPVDTLGQPSTDTSFATAVAMATQAEYTIVALGERPFAEDKANSDAQAFPDGFVTYMKALAATPTKIVLVLVQARPRLLRGIRDMAHAVLYAGLPCELGGTAIADVLTGKANPSGKLSFTYPKTDTPANLATPYYKRTTSTCVTPSASGLGDASTTACPAEWHFGDGLSYTTYTYSALTLSAMTLAMDSANWTNNMIYVSITVQNTGRVAGNESVLVFLAPPPPRPFAETRLLKKYIKLSLAPTQGFVVTFVLTPHDWGYYSNEIGAGLAKSAPSGDYTVFVHAQTDCSVPSNPLCATFKWVNPANAPFPPESASSTTTAPMVSPMPPPITPRGTPAPPSTPATPSATQAAAAAPPSTSPTGLILAVGGTVTAAAMVLVLVVRRHRQQQRREKPALSEIHILQTRDYHVAMIGEASLSGGSTLSLRFSKL
ncbi:hypothetical protein As57867_012329, partial [Aphanomyces stellatus]